MATKVLNFENNRIAFDINADENVMVNATEMAKIFEKDVFGFLRLDSTKAYIQAYCQTADLRSENEFSPEGKLVKVVNGGRNNGTWMERSVALKFAAWLSPKFEVWVYKTIDEILFGEYIQVKAKLKEAANRKLRIEKLNNELSTDPNADKRIQELFQLEETEKKETKSRFSQLGKRIKEYKQMIIKFEEEKK